MTSTTADEGRLVVLAAAAAGVEVDEVVEGLDVAALAAVVARAETAADPVDEAATLLVEIVTRRPFGGASRAAGWLAAAMTLAEAKLDLHVGADAAVELVGRIEQGAAEIDEVCRALRVPGRELPWPCPACGRTLHLDERRHVEGKGGCPWVSAARIELTARCWREHGAHDRGGRPYAPAVAPAAQVDTRWQPVLRNDASGAFLVIVEGGALLCLPDRDAEAWRVVRIAEPAPGDLAGSWARLAESGEPVGIVPLDSISWDAARDAVDVAALVEVAQRSLASA